MALEITLKVILSGLLVLAGTPIIFSLIGFSRSISGDDQLRINFKIGFSSMLKRELVLFEPSLFKLIDSFLKLSVILYIPLSVPWFEKQFLGNQYFSLSLFESGNDLIYLFLALFFIPLLDLMNHLVLDRKKRNLNAVSLDFFIKNVLLFFVFLTIVTTYRTTSIEILIQSQSGYYFNFLPKLGIFENPIGCLAFVLFIIWSEKSNYSTYQLSHLKLHKDQANANIWNLSKIFCFSLILSTLFLGGAKEIFYLEFFGESQTFLAFSQFFSLVVKSIIGLVIIELLVNRIPMQKVQTRFSLFFYLFLPLFLFFFIGKEVLFGVIK